MAIPRDLLELLGPACRPETLRGDARALADLHGNLGETWIVADPTTLHLFSKSVGAAYVRLDLPYSEIAALQLEDDRPFCHLHIEQHDGTAYRLKFAAYDQERLAPLLNRPASGAAAASTAAEKSQPIKVTRSGSEASKATAAAPAAAARTPREPAPPTDALLGFCAALQMLVRADGVIEAAEMHLVHRALANTELVARGMEYLQTHDLDALVSDLNAAMNSDQKLCLMANLLEIAMADGLLRKEERHLIAEFRERLGVKEDNYKAIYDVLLIKNDLSVLSG